MEGSAKIDEKIIRKLRELQPDCLPVSVSPAGDASALSSLGRDLARQKILCKRYSTKSRIAHTHVCGWASFPCPH